MAGAPAAARTIVRVEVTNTLGRSIDVFYSTQYLGTLAPNALGSYSVAPTTERIPLYARWVGELPDQQFNISHNMMVRYVYEDPSVASAKPSTRLEQGR
jgi:hypothetical protein